MKASFGAYFRKFIISFAADNILIIIEVLAAEVFVSACRCRRRREFSDQHGNSNKKLLRIYNEPNYGHFPYFILYSKRLAVNYLYIWIHKLSPIE
uniref:Uncharacterized protein n=1 Tax=Strigamia maritima TaxID=126957 RepID=T1IJJ3_STRMM